MKVKKDDRGLGEVDMPNSQVATSDSSPQSITLAKKTTLNLEYEKTHKRFAPSRLLRFPLSL